MRDAGGREKTDPTHAAELYRAAIVRYLEFTEDPQEREDVRRDLLFIFDRLSLALRRQGLTEEALEEVESAASLRPRVPGLREQGAPRGTEEAPRELAPCCRERFSSPLTREFPERPPISRGVPVRFQPSTESVLLCVWPGRKKRRGRSMRDSGTHWQHNQLLIAGAAQEL